MTPMKLFLLLVLFCIHRANGRQSTTTVRTSKPDDQSEDVIYFATYNSYPNDTNQYGVIATMDVYGFALTPYQESGTAIWVGNPGNGTRSTQNFILAGWHVGPRIYGDSNTHFFVYWTRDGFQKTGCYNLECPGFQQEADAHISPGDVITPVSQINAAKQSITIKVAKKNDTGDWWVYYGFNGPTTAVGHFPESLFTGLANSTWDFAFGGYAGKEGSAPAPPMGSGSSQQGQAASFTGLKYVLQDGTVSPVTGNLTSHTDRSDCYPVTPFVDGKFFYGGPLSSVSDRCELKE